MGGENAFGKGLIEIILCSLTGGKRGKGFAFAMVHNRGIPSSIGNIAWRF
jgi:hypothetical protein